jgi:hypothetical protein
MAWTLDYPHASATLQNGRFSLVLADEDLAALGATTSRQELEERLYEIAERMSNAKSSGEALKQALKADKRRPADQWEELWSLFH